MPRLWCSKQHIGDGEDDCESYYVSQDQLKELRDVCKKVLADTMLADSLLPPQSGFFFGSTAIDESYTDDLTYTVKQLDKLVGDQYKSWDFNYQSSW